MTKTDIKVWSIPAVAFIALITVVVCIILTSCSSPRTLHNGWYSYRELKSRQYDCKPFKGRHYIRATKDTTLVDITPKTQ